MSRVLSPLPLRWTVPREDEPQAWQVVALPTVAQHVLVRRRHRLGLALAAVDHALCGAGDHHARRWRVLSRSLRQHLAAEQSWLRCRTRVLPGLVSSAWGEHEHWEDAFTAWRENFAASASGRWRALEPVVEHFYGEWEKQVYCEQVLLFPRLRGYRVPLQTVAPAIPSPTGGGSCPVSEADGNGR